MTFDWLYTKKYLNHMPKKSRLGQTESIQQFVKQDPTDSTIFRSLILFGSNVQSYKFALGKSLLELAKQGKEIVTLEELAIPFSSKVCEHLMGCDKQGTSKTSKFLDACRDFNSGKISQDQLIRETQDKGFQNVLDAFHNIDGAEAPLRFFDISEVNSTRKRGKIKLSSNLFEMLDSSQSGNLFYEVESRWRLVEEAWKLNISPRLLQVRYDPIQGELYLPEGMVKRRVSITSSREALNGYQRGKCFYCFDDISIEKGASNLADIDHVIPHVIMNRKPELMQYVNIDGVWNLVLACHNCNRVSESGKGSQYLERSLIKRLHKKNEFLIASHNPLRQTLMNQTGLLEKERVTYLQSLYNVSTSVLGGPWKPIMQGAPTF